MENSSHKILIVEDDITLLRLLAVKFDEKGFTVLEAKNGEEGLNLAIIEHPDIILLDIVMPVMDGMSMLTELRKDSWGKNADVIILSNLSDAGRVSEALKNQVYDFLVKTDWTLEDLVKKVKEKLPAK